MLYISSYRDNVRSAIQQRSFQLSGTLLFSARWVFGESARGASQAQACRFLVDQLSRYPCVDRALQLNCLTAGVILFPLVFDLVGLSVPRLEGRESELRLGPAVGGVAAVLRSRCAQKKMVASHATNEDITDLIRRCRSQHLGVLNQIIAGP